jgi:hypothetical protein
MQVFDHHNFFLDKRQFFRRKLAKIAENCDQYVHRPRSIEIAIILFEHVFVDVSAYV